MNDFYCAGCGTRLPEGDWGGRVYPVDYEEYDGKPYCYDCAPGRLLQSMIERGRARLYLKFIEHPNVAQGYGHLEVMNFRGTLRFRVKDWKESGHDLTVNRTDVWFTINDGSVWHGVSYGSGAGTQLCRVKRTKRKSLPEKSFRLGGK